MSVEDPQLVPELAITDVQTSLDFWVGLIGFEILYGRPDEGFAYLRLDRAEIMLDQIGIDRTWETGELISPLGRGINFQLSVPSTDVVLERLVSAAWPLFMAPEEKWYRVDEEAAGVSQFLVQDPDGYLLRVQSSLGRRVLRL